MKKEIITKENYLSPITGGNSEVLIELNNYPITEIYQKFGDNTFEYPTSFNQELRYCKETNHVFLGRLLPQDFIYNSENYNTVSSSSQGSRVALDNFHSFVNKSIPKEVKVIIDIGANDTLMLKKFKNLGVDLIGIDPNINSDDDEILCIKDYFENVDSISEYKSGRVFLCSHTLEHIYDPRVFMDLLAKSSQSDDLYFFQFPSIDLLLRDLRFDQLHHQHIQYFSVESFKRLIEDFGFELVSYNLDSDHYGTLQASFRKTTTIGSIAIHDYISIDNIKRDYNNFLSIVNAANNRLESIKGDFYCFGASLMLPIIYYYIPNLIEAKNIIDDDKSKEGLSYVNFDVEIINSKKINFLNNNFVVTAVATKLATRNIIKKLSDVKAMNIISPLNTL